MLERGLSLNRHVSVWQHRLNPVNCVCGDGCNINCPMRSLIQATQFCQGSIEEFYLAQSPRCGILTKGKITTS